VVAPLEVLRNDPQAPLELIIFAEEEGTTFNLGMLGSRTWMGSLAVEQLRDLKNRDGVDYVTAGEPHGVDPQRLGAERFHAAAYLGLIELHVEQGPAMWNGGVPVAVVTAINGRRQYQCTVTGAANHAGSTKMTDRNDALAAAAEMIVAVESVGKVMQGTLDHTVATVGRIAVAPNAINVIPGSVSFYIDFRARSDEMLERGGGVIEQQLMGIAKRRGVECNLQMTEQLPAMPMAAEVCERLRQAAGRLNVTLPEVASGALHDAAIVAPHLPTAMLFIASEGGISHNPREFSRIEDIALATQILAEAVRS
jgi:allantoate deiminase